MWPVVFRELRVQSRRVATFWLRMVGVLAAIVVFCLLCFQQDIPVNKVGGRLFMSLHSVMMIYIWLAVPLMVADSIARERREGTFGLLFLTPLRPLDVLSGKLLVHFLEAMTLWVAVLPVMIIPFVLGGVGSVDVISALTLQLTSIFLALSAGLLASVCVRDFKWVTGLAAILALVFLALLVYGVVRALMQNGLGAGMWLAAANPRVGVDGLYWLGLTNWMNTWGSHLNAFAKPVFMWLDSLRQIVTNAAALILLVLAVCAFRVGQLSRDRGVSKRELWLFDTFCRPAIRKDFYQSRMRSSLNRNPIGWLHVRSVSGRLTLWVWVGLVSVLETYSVILGQETGPSLQTFIGFLLMAGLAHSSANSFREERQSGALELILVTPIREGTLFWGRLRGIWLQFLPVIALYITAEMAYPWDREDRLLGIGEILVSYFGLPVVGMFVSMQRFNALTATLATLAGWLGVPLLGQTSLWLVETMWTTTGRTIDLVRGHSGVQPGPGDGLVIVGMVCAYLATAVLGVVLYFVVWAPRPGRRLIAVILVVLGSSPFFLMLSRLGHPGLLPVSLTITTFLVLECARCLQQNLRTRRFLDSP